MVTSCETISIPPFGFRLECGARELPAKELRPRPRNHRHHSRKCVLGARNGLPPRVLNADQTRTSARVMRAPCQTVFLMVLRRHPWRPPTWATSPPHSRITVAIWLGNASLSLHPDAPFLRQRRRLDDSPRIRNPAPLKTVPPPPATVAGAPRTVATATCNDNRCRSPLTAGID